ncbi:MAG: UTP--glucose-1-phosphate uridylyltransferase [Myxococcales bacterium]
MHNPLDDARFDRDLLTRYAFEPAIYAQQVEGIKRGRVTGAESIVRGRIEPAPEVESVSWDPDSDSYNRALHAGADAIAQGKVASLVLNGGLATRFGGIVKGIVNAYDERSFLACKLEDARRTADLFGTRVPFILLNSFATAEPTFEHLRSNNYFGLDPNDVLMMDQSISVKVTPEGDPFFGDDGLPRYYAPGHGEFFAVLLRSGIFHELRRRGVEWFTFSNVDNLGATIDPIILGHHVLSRADMTVEVIEKRKNAQGQYDVGGAPAILDGFLQVIEGFRFPPELAPESLKYFQTNNMIFSLAALRDTLILPRYLVKKPVDGRSSIAFEAITCEASGLRRSDGSRVLKLGLLQVPREGKFGRFYPVKSREDLVGLSDALRGRLETNWDHWRGVMSRLKVRSRAGQLAAAGGSGR